MGYPQLHLFPISLSEVSLILQQIIGHFNDGSNWNYEFTLPGVINAIADFPSPNCGPITPGPWPFRTLSRRPLASVTSAFNTAPKQLANRPDSHQ